MSGLTARDLEILEEYQRRRGVKLVIPSRFTEFCDWIGVKLTPGQRILAAVAYDGTDPVDLPEGDKPTAAKLFGDVARIPPSSRGVLVSVCGARGGKTYVLIALRLLHGALRRDLSSLAPGEQALALLVAPTLKLARQGLRYVGGAVNNCADLQGCVASQNADQIVLRRPDGHLVSVEILAASRGGAAIRGRSLTDAALDEAAFFRDQQTGVVNDADLFRAVSPRVLPGGQVIIASTPWTEQGLLFDLFRQNHGKPTTAIAAHAPTLFLHDSPMTREIVAREQERDPDNAAREYGAEFLGGGAAVFFDPATIDNAVDADLKPGRKPLPGEMVTIGADFGFRSDSSALAVVHKDSKTLRLGDLVELRPKDGEPLKPSAVVGAFARVARDHGGASVMADAHYRESVTEHLADHDLGFIPAPMGADVAVPFVHARLMMREGRVRIPNHPRLRAQLRAVVGKPQPGGGVRIVQPRLASGGHGDLVSAFVLALFQAGGVEIKPEAPKPGSDEDRARQQREMLERDDRAMERGRDEWGWMTG